MGNISVVSRDREFHVITVIPANTQDTMMLPVRLETDQIQNTLTAVSNMVIPTTYTYKSSCYYQYTDISL